MFIKGFRWFRAGFKFYLEGKSERVWRNTFRPEAEGKRKQPQVLQTFPGKEKGEGATSPANLRGKGGRGKG